MAGQAANLLTLASRCLTSDLRSMRGSDKMREPSWPELILLLAAASFGEF